MFFLSSCQINESIGVLKQKLLAADKTEVVSKEPKPKTEKKPDKQDVVVEDPKKEKKVDYKEKIIEGIKKAEAEEKNVEFKKKVEEDKVEKSDETPKKKIEKSPNLKSSESGLLELNKPRKEESEILSFFSKFFDPEKFNLEKKNMEEDFVEESGDLYEDEDSNEDFTSENLEPSNEKKIYDAEKEKNSEIPDIIVKDEDLKNQETAFLQLKEPRREEILKKDPEKNNLVGMLLPLTGNKRSAGTLVLNTMRYFIATKPTNLIFKIYDTKGTPNGAIDATEKAMQDDVQTFVGPIFSDETRALRDFFPDNKNLVFFSLSPDFSNVSDNVIVSGQNPEDQIFCITQNLLKFNVEQVLLIHHADKYGQVVKNSLMSSVHNLSALDTVELRFLQISENINMNEEIKTISNYETRKAMLKNKISSIKNDENISKKEKQKEIKMLKKQLTYGDPPFDAIIVASEGDKLLEILSHLAFYDINGGNTLIFGTSLWEDTSTKDNVYENTYFVTNLKNKNKNFIQSFKDVFSKEPASVSFHLFDLIDLVNDFKNSDLNYPENSVHMGEFSTSLVKSGLLRRETFLKQIKNQEFEDVSSCKVDEL